MTLASSQTWTNYLDIDEVKQWLNFPTDASTSKDPQLQRVMDMACEWVQNEINRPIAATTFTELHDGWAGAYIMLNHYPVLEVVSVTEWQSSGGSLSLSESTIANPVDGYQLNYLSGQIMRAMAGYAWPRPFFPGSRNISVTYVAGYNPVPPALWMATVELVKHWWTNTQQASRMTMKPNEFDPAQEQPGLWQGVPYRIIDLIAPYRRIVVG